MLLVLVITSLLLSVFFFSFFFYYDCSISAFSLCRRCVQMHSAVSGALLSYSCAHTLGKILILSGRSKTYVWLFGIGKQEERNLLRAMTWYNC